MIVLLITGRLDPVDVGVVCHRDRALRKACAHHEVILPSTPLLYLRTISKMLSTGILPIRVMEAQVQVRVRVRVRTVLRLSMTFTIIMAPTKSIRLRTHHQHRLDQNSQTLNPYANNRQGTRSISTCSMDYQSSLETGRVDSLRLAEPNLNLICVTRKLLCSKWRAISLLSLHKDNHRSS